MAKKFSRFLAFSVIAGAAAAGTYYYLKNKQDDSMDDLDDFDDFDDFNEDLDDDLDDEPSGTPDSTKGRSYVSLDFDGAKEAISEKVIETIDKAKEKIEEFNVSEKLDKAKEKIEEFANSDSTSKITPEAKDIEDSFGHVEEFFDDNEDE